MCTYLRVTSVVELEEAELIYVLWILTHNLRNQLLKMNLMLYLFIFGRLYFVRALVLEK